MPLPAYTVIASSIDKDQIHFVCPFCFTKYNKNKTPRANSKHRIHHHGNPNGDMSNRIDGYRVPHCDLGRFPEDKFSLFEIVVDSTTIRE
jgi:hypothetical protein